MHGAGFTWFGRALLASVVAVDATPQGPVRIRASSTEIGQGKDTVLPKLPKMRWGPSDIIGWCAPIPREVPDSGPTVASRTVMVVGKLVHSACLALRQKLQEAGLVGESYTAAEFVSACGIFHQLAGPARRKSVSAAGGD